MISYTYANIPYYHSLFNGLNLRPGDIKHIEDLEKIPILNKATVKKKLDKFWPNDLRPFSYYLRSTGGSTGSPLVYRVSRKDRFLSAALLYRGWSHAGYGMGDSMFFLGGSSIGASASSTISRYLNELTRNIVKLSSFDMKESQMHQYVSKINAVRPYFAFGYASSLYFFSKWIEHEDLTIHSPKSIFVTAEKLFPHARKKIEDVFGTSVYDNYGVNDGGVSAYECPRHEGLHIDTERSIMEVVDEGGHQLSSGSGRIIATSLHNYAMPFIRYDTGDIGTLSEELCSCGRGQKLLKDIIGRQQDILVTPEGNNIHGEFFTHIFWAVKGVKEFQVVQRTVDAITISIIPEEEFDERSVQKIKDAVATRSKEWFVDVRIVDRIDRTKAGKYRWVINDTGADRY